MLSFFLHINKKHWQDNKLKNDKEKKEGLSPCCEIIIKGEVKKCSVSNFYLQPSSQPTHLSGHV
jgi:hypothetical protein